MKKWIFIILGLGFTVTGYVLSLAKEQDKEREKTNPPRSPGSPFIQNSPQREVTPPLAGEPLLRRLGDPTRLPPEEDQTAVAVSAHHVLDGEE